MITTKHDLCAGTAKLNLNELIETAKIAVFHARVECERAINRLQNKQFESNYREANHAAQSLESASNNLAKASNTLHYLIEAQNRDEIKVARE